MNKAEFYILADIPQNLDKNTLSDLKSVVKDFPYFQAAQVLLLKNLHTLNHYEYDAVLKKTAVSLPSRIHLYNFIHDKELAVAQIQVAPTALDIEDITTIEPTIAQPTTVEEEQIVAKVELDVETDSEITPAAEVVSPPIAIDTPAVELPPPLVAEVITPIEPEPVIEPTVETQQEEITKPVAETFTNATLSFSEWLKLSQAGNIPAKANTNEEKPTEQVITQLPDSKVTTSSTEEKSSHTLADESEPTTKVEKPESNIGQFESILDKFIRENPRISRPKAEFYNPANMAKQSVQEDEEIATETLAKVYMAQGHYKKAIRVYEKLCLIYPHRITYFADLIQKIKNEHKEKL